MHLKDNPIGLPGDIDHECFELCCTLNRMPGVETYESCCGHLKERYSIWFRSYNLDAIARIARSVDRNYSDGRWELVVDCNDTEPQGCFWLRSKKPFSTDKTMEKSVRNLIRSIEYWCGNEFDKHFGNNKKIWE